MKIENLERASQINGQLEKLNKMKTMLLDQHSMIVVYESTSLNSSHESTWDDELCNAFRKSIAKRISELEKEVTTL